MSLVLEKPERGVVSLRDAMNRMFDLSFLPDELVFPVRFEAQTIPLDMYEEKDKLVVKASVPAIKPEEIKVSVQGNRLTIAGETTEETERKEANYYRHERSYGRFERLLTLPYEVAVDKVEATCKDGILTLTMPKAPKPPNNEIKIKVKT